MVVYVLSLTSEYVPVVMRFVGELPWDLAKSQGTGCRGCEPRDADSD
jgi:hypothetical protein